MGLPSKNEVISCFQSFHIMVKNLFDANIRILRSYNGKEYMDKKFQEYLYENGIVGQTTCYPQQNGKAERKNRHGRKVARALMFTMSMPPKLFLRRRLC